MIDGPDDAPPGVFRAEVVKEFPVLTPEDLEEIEKLSNELCKVFNGEPILSFMPFSGVNHTTIGDGMLYNTLSSLDQLNFAMAMTRHFLVKNIQEPEFDKSKFDAKTLVKSKIMTGMKILDLGCGKIPVFARVCRAMGADVYTVDIETENDLISSHEVFTPEQIDLEKKHYIRAGLETIGVEDSISENSLGGNFHLVTQAVVIPYGHFDGGRIALALLKQGGVYYQVGRKPVLKR